MANPIKSSNLYQDDGALKRGLNELLDFRKAYQDFQKEISGQSNKILVSFKNISGATVEQREEIKKAANQASALEKAQARLAKAQSANAVEIAKVRAETNQINKINRLNVKLANSAAGSYDQLAAQYAKNKIELNALSAEQRKSTKAGQELEANTKEIFEEMKRLQEATGKYVLDVGNYRKATEALEMRLGELPGVLGSAAQGTTALGRGFRALIANPIVGIITAAITALSALAGAFFRSEKGAATLDKIQGALNAGLSLLTKLAVGVADSLTAAFTDPIGALRSFVDSIANNLIVRLQALRDIVVNIGKSAKALFTGDFKALEESSKELGAALERSFQTTLVGKFAKAVSETTKEVVEQTNAFIKLEQARRAVAARNNELARSAELVASKEQELQAIAADSTLSFAEQQQANEEALAATEKRAQLEIQIARNNLSLIDQEIALRRANGEAIVDLVDQQTQAIREVIQAEREFTLAVRSSEQERRQIRQDELERNLDILIDLSDNQKTVNERLLKDERLTFAEREKIYQRTQGELQAAFDAQIATIQEFTNVQVDANDLVNTSDAIALNEKIRSLGLSEIIEGRLIEIIRDRRLAVQDLAEAEVELSEKKEAALLKEVNDRERLLELQKKQELENFNQLQELEKSKFDLTASTAAERANFELEQEKAKLERILALNEKFFGDLSAAQIETIRNQIQKIEQDLSATNDGASGGSLYDLLGLNVDAEQQKKIGAAFELAKQQVTDFFNTKVQLAQQDVETANTAVAQAQRQLEIELQSAEQGQASRVAAARAELAAQEENQRKALKSRERAQRQQILLDTVSQASNVATGVSKTLADFGFPLGPIFAGLIIASFLASKIQAFAAAKKTFGKGGFEFIGGGSHASGNDTALGFMSDGLPAYAEKGEFHGIVNKKQVPKYRHILPDIINSLNRGDFENKFLGGIQLSANNVNTKTMETHLQAIRKQGESIAYNNSKGELVIHYKNLKKTYVNAV